MSNVQNPTVPSTDVAKLLGRLGIPEPPQADTVPEKVFAP